MSAATITIYIKTMAGEMIPVTTPSRIIGRQLCNVVYEALPIEIKPISPLQLLFMEYSKDDWYYTLISLEEGEILSLLVLDYYELSFRFIRKATDVDDERLSPRPYERWMISIQFGNDIVYKKSIYTFPFGLQKEWGWCDIIVITPAFLTIWPVFRLYTEHPLHELVRFPQNMTHESEDELLHDLPLQTSIKYYLNQTMKELKTGCK